MRTWTSWAEVANPSLPKADAVGLYDRGGRILMRRWEEIEAVCGPFVEEPGFDPPRFRCPPWPDARQWMRLASEFHRPPWFPGGDSAPLPVRRRRQSTDGRLRRVRV